MRRIVLSLLLFAALPLAAAEITRQSVLDTMNSYRADRGLPPLRFDARLQKAADDRMRDMEEQEYWAHESPDGRSPFTWVRAEGYDFQYAGENLAAGFETTEVLVASWMESPGHRDNIMSPLYSDCSISIIDGSTRGRATGKSIVVMFGRTRFTAAEPPSRTASSREGADHFR
jgi:uncharacterized protein YkwD